MDTLSSPLVITKLHPPANRPRVIPRARLLNLFDPESGKSFVLVSAPAGYGKTTLLSEYAQSLLGSDIAVAWYALDPSDNDPITFGLYLFTSLIQAFGENPEMATISQRLRVVTEIDLQTILPSVINFMASSERPCTLILDDYHLISSPAIHSAVAFLLEHLPQNLRVIIGSRADPPLPLARLRARGNMIEIRTADLRFKMDETRLFLNEVMDLGLSTDGVVALEERTEGWIAGLQLAALSLAGQMDKEGYIASISGSHRYLVEYLLEEVIDRQPPEVQNFLLATSILERLSAPLCDAILGENFDSAAILEYLERANLFVIALDEQNCWYRYHHLFGNFLQTRLQKNQAEYIPSLHRAACEWLAEHGDLREAARHAFQVGDWEYTAAFVEQHGFTMVIHSEIAALYEWCSAFPEEVMQNHPALCLHQCWALVFSFQRQNRSKVEARLRQADEAIAMMADKQQARDLAEHAAVVRSFLVMAPDQNADPREQLARAQNMLSDYPDGDPGQFSALLLMGYVYMALADTKKAIEVLEKARQAALNGRLFYGVVESTFHLAQLAHHRGRLHAAAELRRQGWEDIARFLDNPEQELPALGCLDIALGCVLLEQDRLDEAEQYIQQGLDILGWSANPYYLLTAYIALFRLDEIRERSEAALARLVRLEQTWPDISFCTRGLRICHALRNKLPGGNWLAEAEAWFDSFPLTDETPLPGMGPFGAAEVYYLAYLARAEVQIAAGRIQEALAYLERQLKLAVANGLIGRVIELSLLEAQAAWVEGDGQRALQALERALVAAQPAGYLRSFDQGSALTVLLVEAANAGICRDYVERILAAVSAPKYREVTCFETAVRSSQTAGMCVIEELSERELEVLRLMAQGATNQVIAEKLVITVGTVKSHINHILGKLGAHNRTEAVARARRFGLISI
jgi:LuxR family maltose regulon positive regulatory protein